MTVPVPDITCAAATLGEFRVALRAQPEIHAFAAALHRAGLIDGLRGAHLAPAGSLPSLGAVPNLAPATETRLLDAEWRRSQGRAGR